MGKVMFVNLLVFSLLLGFLSLATPAQTATTISNQDEIICATFEGGNPDTVDPAIAYDAASSELIFNVYETLIFFDGECVDRFIPQLATEVPTSENGLIQNITGEVSPEGLPWFFRYIFPIRTGVKFHNSTLWGDYTLTPQDVEYSFERGLVQDRRGGPQWMFYEPLLNSFGAEYLGNLSNAEDIALVGKMIDHAVESNATHVWFNLAFPGAYRPFLQILCQCRASVISKQWVNDYVIGTLGRPDWNGEWNTYEDWINYRDPDESPLGDYGTTPVMCGTGPYQLETLDQANMYWSAVRFADYWRGWPADWPAPPYPSNPAINPKPAGYVNRVKVTWAYIWPTRRDMFLNGDLDFCNVPSQYKDEITGQLGIRCFDKLPALSISSMFFTIDLNPVSPYLGVLGGLPSNTFNESGIPRDFFLNMHIRKAFAYSFNYSDYIEQLSSSDYFTGEALQAATWCPVGFPYWNPNQEGYSLDVAKAEEEFRLAWDGQVWEDGFKVEIIYPVTSSPDWCMWGRILKPTIESLNPKFHIELVMAPGGWGTYYTIIMNGEAPLFTMGWLADYADPENFVRPFMHSSYAFASWQRYGNETIDDLIEEGVGTINTTRRREIYYELQRIYHEDCPSVPLHQSAGFHFERDWVQGWYYNPVYPSFYFYPLWKQEAIQGDVNYDGVVDMKDIGFICQAYGSTYGPPMHQRWNFRCDVDNDRKTDMKDIGYTAKHYGETP
jgi:peptide/nickel transport system substrate-binding protein